MKELSENERVWAKILGERTIHVFSLGFEERCLAYPAELSRANPHGGRQVFRCVRLPDDKVNSSLRARRKRNESSLKDLLPATVITSLKEIEQEIKSADLFDNFCLDISTLPRASVFRLLQRVIEKSRGQFLSSLFIAIRTSILPARWEIHLRKSPFILKTPN